MATFGDVCRLCQCSSLGKSRRLIFPESFLVREQLVEVSGQIPSPTDGLSKYVCVRCFGKFNRLSKLDFDIQNKVDVLKRDKQILLSELRQSLHIVPSFVAQPKTQNRDVVKMGGMFIPAFTINAMTSDFLSSVSLCWVVMFLGSKRMVFIFLSWLNLVVVALAFWISIQRNFKLLPNYWHRVDITSLEHLESSSGFWRKISTALLRWFRVQTQKGQTRIEFGLVGLENSQTPSIWK